MNAMEWNRDLQRPIAEINRREAGLTDKPDRGNATVCFEELRRGNVGLVVATQIARWVAPDNPLPGWHSPQQAWAHTQGQLAWYRAMEEAGELTQVADLQSLDAHLSRWNDASIATAKKPIGYILSLEGADSLVTPDYVERAWHYGLRAIGPGHYGPGRYANGTNSTGRMGPLGLGLLRKMAEFNIILDATHLCDDAFWQAMEQYDGPVWASHNNCRALVDGNRQFSDEMIRELVGRGAVIGAVLDAWMVINGWVKRVSTPEGMGLSLERVADHVDHICQLAGNANHVGIGSDLDGAFGREQCPYDVETIADLQRFTGILERRGYSRGDIEQFMHGNWLRFLRRAWG
jgi:membrane dipeptidase